MTLGFAVRLTLRSPGEHLFVPIEHLEEMVFLVFFTIAGTYFRNL
jgi:hypothetical protein